MGHKPQYPSFIQCAKKGPIYNYEVFERTRFYRFRRKSLRHHVGVVRDRLPDQGQDVPPLPQVMIFKDPVKLGVDSALGKVHHVDDLAVDVVSQQVQRDASSQH